MVEALQAGAAGYVVKDSAPAEILMAVRSVARGEQPQESVETVDGV
jgi:DNA-binding NarL/FixJ family response regulator